jgi:hypothetical protein
MQPRTRIERGVQLGWAFLAAPLGAAFDTTPTASERKEPAIRRAALPRAALPRAALPRAALPRAALPRAAALWGTSERRTSAREPKTHEARLASR